MRKKPVAGARGLLPWRRDRGVDGYLREVLPGPPAARWREGPVHHR